MRPPDEAASSTESLREADWQRREALLDRLLDLPAGEREAFLEQVAREDPDDALALRGWLGGIERSDDYLVAKAPGDPIGHDGEIVGNWRALRPIGRGGMGEVWLGERADGLFSKKVAIKFIRDDRPALARNIESERRMLAGLQHPGIVRLLDAGMLTDGHPYLVTDHIDGVTLDAWLVRDKPPLSARLDLFRQVGEAVAYAHERLVIHRDIKPANILVDANMRAHLLDFGIARALAHEADAPQATQVALTPEFAAPELLVDNSASVRSDVYALGGLLYFLLCERPPLALRGLALGTMIATIRDEVPTPPGTHSDLAAAVPRALLADLDAIALKALAKAPAERYGAVDALLADIAAARERRPVSARTPDALDRFLRSLHRHRVGVSIAAVLLASLLAGVAGTLWQAHEARLQRDRAETEAERATAQAATAETVRDFLIGVFESANPEMTGGRTPTALELVDNGVRQAEMDLAAQPGLQARLFEALGRTYIGLGEYTKATQLLERAYALAVKRLGKSSEEAVSLAIALGSAVGYGDGPYDRTLALFEDIAGMPRGESVESARQLAVATYQLATLQRRVGRLDESEANFRRAVEDLRELGAPVEVDLAEALHQFAGLDESRGRRSDAIERLREAIRIRERGSFGPSTDLNFLREELAKLLGSAGFGDESVVILRAVVASNRSIYGDAHPRVLDGSSWLARGLVRQSAYAEADGILAQVLETARAQYGEDSEIVAGAEISLAASKFAQGDLAAAIDYGERVRRYAIAHGGEDSYRAIVTTQNIARFHLAKGDYDETERVASGVLDALRRIGSRDTADALELIGNARQYRGDAAGAREAHREALESLRRNGDEDSFDVQMLKTELAEDERDLGNLAAARVLAHEALDGLLRLDQSANDKMIVFTRALLAQFDVLEGRCDGAAEIEAVIAQQREVAMTPTTRWRTAWAEVLLGSCRAGSAAGGAAMPAEAWRIVMDSALVDPHVRRLARALPGAPRGSAGQ